ncbi:GntR family transcriptional regulator [Novacetimonas cocois]|uniref:GntR family transcriptional regulator n=2 Tax=Novacetimonas cocois TaxID=1747507 RepID=A0A365Z2J7_9PROT|nr:GntR family transcriptional regulator [Novacetimonas cocois]
MGHNLLSSPRVAACRALLSDMTMSDKFNRNPEQHDRAMNEVFPVYIERVTLRAVMAHLLVPGTCLSEGRLADAFGASRATVREALVRLEGRGLVRVVAKRGWFIPEQGRGEIRATCEARRIIQIGILRLTVPLPPDRAAAGLRHLARQRAAMEDGDISHLSFLLADFHVWLARLLDNPILTENMRSLMARSSLALPRPTLHDARIIHGEYHALVHAMTAGDLPRAQKLLLTRIESAQAPAASPHAPSSPPDLKTALAPVLRRIKREKAHSSPAPNPYRQPETRV